MHRRRALVPLAAAALAGAALAGRASAATLAADPGSVRAALPCDAATPCTLEYALSAAASGDDVALAPGDYFRPGTSAPLDTLPPVKSGVVLHGSPGAPAAVLHGLITGNATPFLPVSGGGTVRDLELRSTPKPGINYAYGLLLYDGGLAERVSVRHTGASGTWSTSCAVGSGMLRDSVCLGDGPGRVDAVSGTSSAAVTYTVRNVTAVTTAASGVGVRLGVSSQTSAMNATNVIARGTSSDVEAAAGLATGHATLVVDHSNWVTQSLAGTGTPEIVIGAGNQNGIGAPQPLFADAARGDVRQRAGSPTIDAGAPGSAGERALGGGPRTVGATADIGADEFVPAPPPSAPSSGGAGGGTPADRTAPALSGARVVRTARGAGLRLTLSEPAALRVTLSRTDRRRPSVVFSRRVAAGAGTVEVRLGRLAAGRYRLVIAATDGAGNRARSRTLRFAVRRSRAVPCRPPDVLRRRSLGSRGAHPEAPRGGT